MSVDANDTGAPDRGRLRRRRRNWSEAEKRRIVAESYEPGNSVSLVARRHDVNANQVFTWRRQLRQQELGAPASGFVPMVVTGEPACEASAMEGKPAAQGDEASVTRLPPATGRIEIMLGGSCRVIVDAAVDAAALARVLAVLEGR